MMLHSHVPAFVVAVVDQLPGYHPIVLASNCRDDAIADAGAVGPVAGSATRKELFAVHDVRLATKRRGKLLLGNRRTVGRERQPGGNQPPCSSHSVESH